MPSATPISSHADQAHDLSHILSGLSFDGRAGNLDYKLLGNIAVVDSGGSELPIGGVRRRTVLAIMLLQPGHVFPIDRIVGLAWGDNPPSSARNAAQAHISRLRKELHARTDAELVTSTAGYHLNIDPAHIDLFRFRHLVSASRETSQPRQAFELLEQALALWRGPALGGASPGSQLTYVAQGLEDERLAAAEDRVAIAIKLRQHNLAIAELAQLISQYPLRERLHELRAIALHLAGRKTEALRVFPTFRNKLVDQLAIEPGPSLNQVHTRILRGAGEANLLEFLD